MHNVRRQAPVPISEEAAAEQRSIELQQLENLQQLERDVAERVCSCLPARTKRSYL